MKARFESKFQKTEGCWIWQAHVKETGYGQFTVDNKPARAHRVSYELYVGVIPEGLDVLHRCDNRKCVNPDHLFLGTNDDNIQDKVRKGRQLKGSKVIHSKLIESQVIEIKALHKAGNTARAIAKQYGVSERAIGKIVNGQSWKSAIAKAEGKTLGVS